MALCRAGGLLGRSSDGMMSAPALVFMPSLDSFWAEAGVVCDAEPGLNQMLAGVACGLLRNAEARATFETNSNLMGICHGEV